MRTKRAVNDIPIYLFGYLFVLWLLPAVGYAQGVVITPKVNLIFPLDATGNKTIVPGDVATVSNAGNATVTVSPAAFTCAQLGNQIVTVTATEPSSVEFSNPVGIVTDPAGDIFFTDPNNHLIKKITPDGTVSTYAGSGADGNINGAANVASFGDPAWMTIDHQGNLFVVDYEFNEIRKITPDGTVSNFGSGFNQQIQGVASDHANNIFVTLGTYIDKITPAGTVSLFAGINSVGNQDGTGQAARFSFVRGIIIDPSDNLFVLDYGNAEIRKITPGAVVTTIYRFTQYSVDSWLTMDAAGDLFMTEQFRVWELSASGAISSFVGGPFETNQGFKDGTGGSAKFNQLAEITTDAAGNMYVTDQGNNAIRKISPAGVVTTLAGGVAGNQNGNIYYSSVTSRQVPVTIISTPTIAAHADEVIQPGPNCNAVMPDYATNAAAGDVCSQAQLKVTQSPAVGTAIPLNSNISVTLTVTDGFGGTASTTFSVTSKDQPVITPKSGPIVLLLDASGNYTVQLSDVATVSGCSAAIDATFSPAVFSCTDIGPQTVTVTATYPSTGSSSILQIPVSVTSSLTIASINNTTLQGNGFCPLQLPDYTQTAKATDNCFPVTFTQTPTAGTILTGSAPVMVTIIATDGHQHTAQTSFTVTPSTAPPPVPSITITPSAPEICSGTALIFTANPMNFGTGLSYQWQVNGHDDGSNAATFTTANLNDGDQVTCTVSSSISCITPVTSQPATVKVDPLPQISLPGHVDIDAGQSIQLTPMISSSLSSVKWSPATGLSSTTVLNPVASPLKTTIYQIVVTNASGCQDSVQVTIAVLKSVLVPNAFTPNGDGINDAWNIANLSDYTHCTVDVFNRSGQQLFHSVGYPVAWDGTYGGKNLPSGTYYYVIDLKNGTGKLAGFVAIVR